MRARRAEVIRRMLTDRMISGMRAAGAVRWPYIALLLTGLLLGGCGSNAAADGGVASTGSLPDEAVSEQEVFAQSKEGSDMTGKLQSGAEAETGEKRQLEAEAVLPEDDNLVRVRDYIPNLLVDLKYATEDNFTGEVIYDFSDAYLRYGTVRRLQVVQEEMEARGLTLKIWDAFRPIEAQQTLWDAYPDPTYVSNPDRGYTSHNFGNTVDITVVKSSGEEIELPTGFDDFSEKADRDYSDCSAEEAENAIMLENAMEEAGFTGYQGEWWHYQDIDDYPGEDLQGVILL